MFRELNAMSYNRLLDEEDPPALLITHDSIEVDQDQAHLFATHPLTHCHLDDAAVQIAQSRKSERILWTVAFLSAVFIAIELVGSVFAHSLAIASDAGHMVSDLGSFLISIFAIRYARSRPTKRLSFGYARAEILGAVVSLMILWIITIVMVLLAVQRVMENKYDIEGRIMIYTSIAGVIFNIIMAIILRGGPGHSHHGMSHSHDHEDGTKNVNVRAAFIHVVGDLVQSVGVLVSAILVEYAEYKIADPICTFVFSLIVLITSYPIVRDIVLMLMEGTPHSVDVSDVRQHLLGVNGVKGVHDLHIWALNNEKLALSAHIAIENPADAVYTSANARNMLRENFKSHKFHSITLQTELDEPETDCISCQQTV